MLLTHLIPAWQAGYLSSSRDVGLLSPRPATHRTSRRVRGSGRVVGAWRTGDRAEQRATFGRPRRPRHSGPVDGRQLDEPAKHRVRDRPRGRRVCHVSPRTRGPARDDGDVPRSPGGDGSDSDVAGRADSRAAARGGSHRRRSRGADRLSHRRQLPGGADARGTCTAPGPKPRARRDRDRVGD